METADADATVATQKNNEQMAAVIARLKELGIADADIQTSGFNLYLTREPIDGKDSAQLTDMYRVHNSVHVKVRALSTLGSVLSEAVSAGANFAGGVQFTIDKPEALISQARTKAMEAAKAKAGELAALAGTTLGPALRINEDSGGVPIYTRAALDAKGAGASVPIEAGQTELTVSVTVTYSLGQ